MGVTGSGKSTFISHLTDRPVQIGHTLESCTIDATVHTIEYGLEQNLHLIDTPGFNDTSRSDSDLLKEIAFILGALRKAEVSVAGIIYLHRISEPRIAGSTLRSMRIFEALCGSHCFPYVVLVSTMWESLGSEDYAIAVDREKTLAEKDQFWGRMVNGGAIVKRHEGDASSARDILSCAASMWRSVVMDIQRELIDEDKALDETSAGHYLLGELRDVRRRQKKEIAELEGIMEDALQDHNEATISAISVQREEYEGLIRRTDTQKDDLEVTFEDLAEERADRYASLFREGNKREKELEEQRNQIEDLKDELYRIEDSYSRDRSRLARDNKRLKQQTEQYAAQKRLLEERLNEKVAASKSAEAALQHYQQTETIWQKVLRSALPWDLRKVASSYRSLSFPQSRLSMHQSQTLPFPQPPQLRTDQARPQTYHDGMPTKSGKLHSSSDGRPRLARRSRSSQSNSDRSHREYDHRSSKERSETMPSNWAQSLYNPRTTIVEPPVQSWRTDQTSRHEAMHVSPEYKLVTPALGPRRKLDELTSLRRSYN